LSHSYNAGSKDDGRWLRGEKGRDVPRQKERSDGREGGSLSGSRKVEAQTTQSPLSEVNSEKRPGGGERGQTGGERGVCQKKEERSGGRRCGREETVPTSC